VGAFGVATALGVSATGRQRDDEATLRALAEGVTAGLVAAGVAELAGARVVVEPDPAGGSVALVDGVDDDAATRWADALAEVVGPLGTPRWLVAVGAPGDGSAEAWRVPAAVGATREAAEAFAAAVRDRIPGAVLVRAGTPQATALVLAARSRAASAAGIDQTLRWRPQTKPPTKLRA
jgi:hypothetical protein